MYQRKIIHSVLVLSCAALAGTAASAQTPQLNPPSQRISDEAIYADHAQYQAQQDRLEAINAAGRPVLAVEKLSNCKVTSLTAATTSPPTNK